MRPNRSTLCTCQTCGSTFRANRYRIEHGGGRYCSKPCVSQGRSNRVTLTCEACGTAFERKVSGIRGERPYCSNACRFARRTQKIVLSDDGQTALIPLYARDGTLKAHAIIDAADAEWASQFNWHLSAKGYVVRGRGIRLHRGLLELTDDEVFGDHINLNKLDNRRSNLRPATPSESPQNVPGRPASSEHRGVAWTPRRRKWHAYCDLGGRRVYSEFFESENEAISAAQNARERFLPFATN